MPKRADPFKSVQGSHKTEDFIAVNGMIRNGRLIMPEIAERERTFAINQAITLGNTEGLRRAKTSNLSRKQRKLARDLKSSMLAFVKDYGTKEQYARFEKISSARIAWMFQNGTINLEEFFGYTDTDELGLMMTHSQASRVQRVLDDYDRMMQS